MHDATTCDATSCCIAVHTSVHHALHIYGCRQGFAPHSGNGGTARAVRRRHAHGWRMRLLCVNPLASRHATRVRLHKKGRPRASGRRLVACISTSADARSPIHRSAQACSLAPSFGRVPCVTRSHELTRQSPQQALPSFSLCPIGRTGACDSVAACCQV